MRLDLDHMLLVESRINYMLRVGRLLLTIVVSMRLPGLRLGQPLLLLLF